MEWVGHVSKKLSFYVSEFAMHFMFHFVSVSFFFIFWLLPSHLASRWNDDIHTYTLDRNDFALTSYWEKCNGRFFSFILSVRYGTMACESARREIKLNVEFCAVFFFSSFSASSINKIDTTQRGNAGFSIQPMLFNGQSQNQIFSFNFIRLLIDLYPKIRIGFRHLIRTYFSFQILAMALNCVVRILFECFVIYIKIKNKCKMKPKTRNTAENKNLHKNVEIPLNSCSI